MPIDELQPLIDQNTWILKHDNETHRTFISQADLSLNQLSAKGLLASPYIQNCGYIQADNRNYLYIQNKINLLIRTETQLIFKNTRNDFTPLSKDSEKLNQLDQCFSDTYVTMPYGMQLTCFDLYRIEQLILIEETVLKKTLGTLRCNPFHSPDRVNRLWRQMNPPDCPLLSNAIAWLTLSLPQEKLTDTDMARIILRFYREKERLLLAPFDSLFSIRDASKTCLVVYSDVITAWPRGSVFYNFKQQEVHEPQLRALYEANKKNYPLTVQMLETLLYLEECAIGETIDNRYLNRDALPIVSQFESERAPMNEVNIDIFFSLHELGILSSLQNNNKLSLYTHLSHHQFSHALMYFVQYESNFTARHLEQKEQYMDEETFFLYVETRNDNRETALIFAASIGNEDAVTALLTHDANINAQDQYGRTALMRAIDIQSVSIVQCLCLNPRLDMTLQDKEQRNALDIAIQHSKTSWTDEKTGPELITNASKKQQFKAIIKLLLQAALKLKPAQQKEFVKKTDPCCDDVLEYMACYYADDYYNISSYVSNDKNHPLFEKYNYLFLAMHFFSKIDFYSFLALLTKTANDCQDPTKKNDLNRFYNEMHLARLNFFRGTQTEFYYHVDRFQLHCNVIFSQADHTLIYRHYYWAGGAFRSLTSSQEDRFFYGFYKRNKQSLTTNLENVAATIKLPGQQV